MLIVALTGWGQLDDRTRSQEAGFNAHFVKPPQHVAAFERPLRIARNAAGREGERERGCDRLRVLGGVRALRVPGRQDDDPGLTTEFRVQGPEKGPSGPYVSQT